MTWRFEFVESRRGVASNTVCQWSTLPNSDNPITTCERPLDHFNPSACHYPQPGPGASAPYLRLPVTFQLYLYNNYAVYNKSGLCFMVSHFTALILKYHRRVGKELVLNYTIEEIRKIVLGFTAYNYSKYLASLNGMFWNCLLYSYKTKVHAKVN